VDWKHNDFWTAEEWESSNDCARCYIEKVLLTLFEFGNDIGNDAGLNLSFPLADLYFGVSQANIPLLIQTSIGNNAMIFLDLEQLHASILLEL
jgi:hypothetical protein